MQCGRCGGRLTEGGGQSRKNMSFYGNVVEIKYISYICYDCGDAWVEDYDLNILTFKEYYEEANT